MYGSAADPGTNTADRWQSDTTRLIGSRLAWVLLPRQLDLRWQRCGYGALDLAAQGGELCRHQLQRSGLGAELCELRALPVGAGNPVTVADLGIFAWVHEDQGQDLPAREPCTRHLQYLCPYGSPTWRCCACSGGSPCSPAPIASRTRRS